MPRIARVARRRAVVGTAMGVAATASMVSNARRNRAERQAIENMDQTNQQQAPQYEEQYAEPVSAMSPMEEQLTSLNNMKLNGLITQEEYDLKKQQILGI